MSSSDWDEWYRDQLAKSQFFHARLHDWHLLETAREIEAVKGENLDWNLGEPQLHHYSRVAGGRADAVGT